MQTIPCPGCSTALEPSATVCPICTRPRNKVEIMRAYATLREMEKQRRRRPFIGAAYLLAAGAAGWLLYRFHVPLIEFAGSARARVGALVDQTLDSAVPAPRPAAAPAEPATAPAVEVATAAAAAASAFPQAPSAPAPASPGATGAPPSPPPAAAPKAGARPAHVEDLPLPSFDPTTQWVFYGRVYDVITLQPVPDVVFNFTTVSQYGVMGGGPSGNMPSDADGRFMAVLRRLPEGSTYEIHSSRQGYASPVLYESDIPYATLPLSERRSIARNAQDGDLTLPPLTDIAGEGSMRRDVFIAPNR